MEGKSKYWIDKERYFELKHLCLQYPHLAQKDNRRKLINSALSNFDPITQGYLIDTALYGLSFDKVVRKGCVIDKDKFYDAFRKFFWILDKRRH